jgi:hypothetical protein
MVLNLPLTDAGPFSIEHFFSASKSQQILQFESPGSRRHVALPPKAVLRAESKSVNIAAARTQAGAPRRRPEEIISLISLRRNELRKLCVILIATTSSCASDPVVHCFPCGKRVRWSS